MRIAQIAVEKAAYHFDKLYDYAVPDGLEVAPGQRVVVPFGRGGRRIGLCMGVREGEPEPGVSLKVVLGEADREPVLSPEMLGVLRMLRETTFCTWFDALSVLLPAGYGVRSRRGYTLLRGAEAPEDLPEAQAQVLELLRGRRAPLDDGQISDLLGIAKGRLPLAELESRGLIQGEDMVSRRVGDARQKMVRLTESYPGALLTPKQREAAALLEAAGQASAAELCYFSGVGRSVVDRLVESGAAEYYEEEVYRDPYRGSDRKPEPDDTVLSPQQAAALEALWARYRAGAGPALLYGVTGSGKTLVYMELIRRVLSEGRRAIVLVPEISLTPQVIERFHRAFGARVAVIHSGLSMSERLDEWKRIRDGGADLVVGTRSAVFAPAEKIGLIVVDEEQEHTYKSEASPRYDAREIAAYRCAQSGGLLLLASATPSVESYWRAQSGRYLLCELPLRYGGASLPEIRIVDMHTPEITAEGFSTELCGEILKNLERGEQTILLVNRRGYSAQACCMKCRRPAECPNCSVPLRYHAANHRLMCHYCGYSQPVPERCPFCGSEYIRYSGMGTQKAEEILHQLYPAARVLRMDADSTLRKFSHQTLLGAFGRGEYDILVGTQMVAKGLDFPNVTLVGVLAADQSLYADDFRSFERTFALLTQVAGRSGRSGLPGRAVIQTYTPENPVIAAAATQDYPAFFAQEIRSRRLGLYPPFCRLYCVGVVGAQQAQTLQVAARLHRRITELLREDYPKLPARVLDVSEAAVLRVAGRYRYKIIVKSRNCPESRALFARLLSETGEAAAGGVSVFIDPHYDSNF